MIAALAICTTILDTPSTHWAAANLADNLQKICPQLTVPVLNITATQPCIGVGKNAAQLFAFQYPREPKDTTSLAESYAMGKIPNMNDAFVLTGDPHNLDDDQRGTVYAATAFVEQLGLRFLDAKTTVATLACPFTEHGNQFPPDSSYSPPLEYRSVLAWDITKHPTFAQNLHNNGQSSGEGGGTSYATPPGFVHTSYKLLDPTWTANSPPPQLYEANPTWFWGNKSSYGQLCWSNQSLIEFVKKNVIDFLHRQPGATVISVSQNDNYDYCNSTAERAIYDDENGSLIGPILRAVNKIADAVKQEFPNRDVAVDTLAYQWTRAAPTKTYPRDNVIVRLCSIECNFGAPLSDKSNVKFQTDIVNWGKFSNRTWIWNYVTDFHAYTMPWPDYKNLKPNTLFYKKHGSTGIFQEAAYESYASDLAPMKNYLMSKLLWDPTTNDTEVMAEFFDLYYGGSVGKKMMQYVDLWSNAVSSIDFYMGESVNETSAYLSPSNLLKSAVLCAPDASQTNEQAKRLRIQSLSTMYVILLRWNEIEKYATDHQILWPYDQTKALDAYEAFSTIFINDANATILSESGTNLTWLKSKCCE